MALAGTQSNRPRLPALPQGLPKTQQDWDRLVNVFQQWQQQLQLPGRTAAEIAAGVTPVNFAYAPGNVLRYGADPTGVNDSTTAIQAALNVANQGGIYGCYAPAGSYKTTVTLTVYPNTVLRGDGRATTVIEYTGTGDGIQSIQSINASTAVRIEVRDFGITCTNATSAGGAYVDVGGSYWALRNVRTSGFKFGVVLDQSEICAIRDCEFQIPAIANATGCWLVNGADHTVGANGLYTNRVTIDGCQFNAATGATNYGIVDDGGTNHTISNCNVNAPSFGMRFANVFGLTLIDNESESCPSVDVDFEETTAGIGLLSSTYAGPVVGFKALGNVWISTGISHNLRLASARNGVVSGNVFGQAVGACISFFGGATNPCSGIVIEGNEKLVTGTGKTAAPFFSASTLAILRANKLRQVPQTYVSGALAATGSQIVTPETMENIKVGTRLMARNADGSNTEQISITAITSTQLTATFASVKAANWVLLGITGWDEEEGTWTPVLAGATTAGANTYAADTFGKWQRRGNFVHVSGVIDISAKDASMSGSLEITGLPFEASNVTNYNGMAAVSLFSGFTFATASTQMGGFISNGGTNIQLRRSGSGVALTPVAATDIASTTCSLYFEATYSTDSA